MSELVSPKILKTESLSAYFGKFQALKNISVGITEREVQALIGPSGCGKTARRNSWSLR